MYGNLFSSAVYSILYFLFYTAFLKKDIDYKNDWWKLVFYVASISLYIILSPSIGSPWRLILMLIVTQIAFSFLLEDKKIANLSVILISFILVMGATFIISALVLGISYLIIPNNDLWEIRNTIIFLLVGLCGLLFYKKIKNKDAMNFLREIEMQALSYILGFIFITTYFYFQLKPEYEMSIYYSFTIVFTCIIIGSLCTVVFLIRRYKERMRMQTELKSQKATFEEMLETTKANLMKELEITNAANFEMMSELHTTSKIIPTYMEAFELQFANLFKEKSVDEMREFVKDNLKTLQDIRTMYFGYKTSSITKAQLSARKAGTSWSAFNILYEKWNEGAIKDGVRLRLNAVTDFKVIENLGIPQNKILEMLADHVDNAFKELKKSKYPNCEICISIKKKDGVLEIGIEDSAKEFSLDVLANIGERGVTTGGTGHGFANTLKTATLYGISLIIHEYAPESKCECNKCITLRFDEKGQFLIRSYRADSIKAVIGNTKATIEHVEEIVESISKYANVDQLLSLLSEEESKKIATI